MKRIQRTAIPDDVLDRILALERRLDDLEGFATLPTVDPESGGDTYVNVLQEVEVLEGDGLDVEGTAPSYTVSLGMELPLLWDGTNPPVEYDTLAAAIAAATSGDTIYLPPGTYSGDHTIPAGVTLAGMVDADCVLTGQIATSNLSRVENLTIDRDENSADVAYGLVGPAVDEVAYAEGVTISVTNAGTGTGVGLTVFGKGDFGTGDDDPGLVDCNFVGCDQDIAR